MRRPATYVRTAFAAWALSAALLGAAGFAASVAHASSAPASGELARLYRQGVRRFDAGDWAGAEAAWDSLVSMGVRSADVWYDIGCAAFKRGDLGRAILAWERARRLAPRDDDVRANLALARTLLADQQLVVRRGRIRRALTWVPDHLSDAEMHRLADAFLVLACALGVLLAWRRRPGVQRFWRRVSMLSPGRLFGLGVTGDLVLATSVAAALFVLTETTVTLRERAEAARRDAVVVVDEAPAYAAPDAGSTHQFDLHAGTRVRLGRRRGAWVEVRLPGDLSGWIRLDAVEAI